MKENGSEDLHETSRPIRSFVRSSQVVFDTTADVVVVGAGSAGHSAALHARADGADVIMLEAANFVGGTTNKSAAWYWMPNNKHLRSEGLVDNKEDAIRYMARLSRPQMYREDAERFGLPKWEYELIEAFYDNASDAAESLEQLGAITAYHAKEIPDYYANLPENKTPYGRVLQPRDDDGNVGFGEVLVAGLNRAAEKAGVETKLNRRVRQLVINERDEVVGVIAVLPDGSTEAYRSRKAVIFSTGGFAHNPELRRNFLFGPVFGSCAVEASQGDLIEIASDLGAPLRNMNYPWGAPMPLERALWGDKDDPNVMCMFAPPGDSMVFVNKYGKRVVNEKLQYHEAMQAFQTWDGYKAEYSNLFLFMIWDQASDDRYRGTALGNPISPPGESRSHIVSSPTIAGLKEAIAEKLLELREHVGDFQLDSEFSSTLENTIERFNGHARTGIDEDFHRGDGPIEHYFNSFNGPTRPENDKNPLMFPFDSDGPFYATIIAPATLDTKGGPMTNVHGQILDQAGEPIPGLYGAGNCVASPSGKAYWAGGGTIGPAFTFGYLAGKHAAAAPELSAGVTSQTEITTSS
ncbi:FAD-dependent oxidoreductase [Arthrobacter sp. TS-15]|uniref:FAD-dependent oxidoreductase n=1 Tax=Arthrobacter sp. TS-15 TaxID=2510797 RepID=UPI00115D88E8|nr:FAD-dependent oxidoreductase [Arthrobacter sp. TS-15]TQS87379.1 FAD-dependent oxidoreductase [Arthrobacter sp. TS-15]